MSGAFNLDDLNMTVEVGDLKLKVLSIKYGVFTVSIGAHIHSNNTYELHFVPFGKGTLIANGKKYELYKNILYMTGPDVVHEQYFDPNEPMAEYCICFENRTPKNDSDIAKLFLGKNFYYGEDFDNLALEFERINKDNQTRHIAYYESIKNSIERIVIGLLKIYSKDLQIFAKVPTKTLDDKRISVIDDFFLWDYPNKTLKDLALRLSLSPRQTERFLKKHYNLSFSQKKLNARMDTAKSLLKNTSLPVKDISERLGYSSLEHFSFAFKKHTGVSPRVYRNSIK